MLYTFIGIPPAARQRTPPRLALTRARSVLRLQLGRCSALSGSCGGAPCSWGWGWSQAYIRIKPLQRCGWLAFQAGRQHYDEGKTKRCRRRPRQTLSLTQSGRLRWNAMISKRVNTAVGHQCMLTNLLNSGRCKGRHCCAHKIYWCEVKHY